MKLTWIAATALGVSTIALSEKSATPLVIWNASPSVPVGFYRIRRAPPQRGELAVVRLDAHNSDYVRRRGYMTGTNLLLKPVAAIEGDRVCRVGTAVLVGPLIVTRARPMDSAGRAMPLWSGCSTLKAGELFLISYADSSFDGRYFGVISAKQVIGSATKR